MVPAARAPGVRRSLRLSVIDGMLHAAMVGASESFLGALAVELGHAGTDLALLSSVPLLAGAVAQMLAPHLTRVVGSVERFVVTGALLQAVSHVGLAAVALSGSPSFTALLLAKIVFWVSGSMIGPGWGTWIAGLTRGVDRPTWLARRTGLVHGALLVSFVGSGFFLHDAGDELLSRLAVLHGVGLLFRLASAAALHGQARLRPQPAPKGAEPPAGRRRYTIPLLAAGVWFAVSMTSPFFTPYMLRELSLSYLAFTGLLAAAVCSRALVAPLLPRVLKGVGLRGLALLGGLGIAATPLFWALSDDVNVLFASQVFSGACWAAYEYASFQLLLEAAGTKDRLRFLSLAGFLTMGAGVVGAVLGGQLLQSGTFSFPELFGWGAAVRVVPLLAFVAAGGVSLRAIRPVILRLETVRPGAGALARVVSLPDDEPSLANAAPTGEPRVPDDQGRATSGANTRARHSSRS